MHFRIESNPGSSRETESVCSYMVVKGFKRVMLVDNAIVLVATSSPAYTDSIFGTL